MERRAARFWSLVTRLQQQIRRRQKDVGKHLCYDVWLDSLSGEERQRVRAKAQNMEAPSRKKKHLSKMSLLTWKHLEITGKTAASTHWSEILAKVIICR